MMHFCWLPPERLVIAAPPPAVLIASRSIDSATARASARPSIRPPRVRASRRRIVMFSATVIALKRPSALRSSVTSATPGRDRLARVAEPDGLAVERDRAGRRQRAGAEEGLEQFGPPGAEQPGDAEHLAGVDLKREVGQSRPAAHGGAGQRQAGDVEHRARADRVRLVVHRRDLAPDHPAHDLRGVGLGAGRAGDELAVAEDRHAVGQGEDLVHLVRDVEDGRARLAEVVDHPEEPVDLGVGQGRGRLIHDQDRGLVRQRLGDLDHLLVADPQAADHGARD